MMVSVASAIFYTRSYTRSSWPITLFPTQNEYQLRDETAMARKAGATLWMLLKIGERFLMKRLVRKGRSYIPSVEGAYLPGSY